MTAEALRALDEGRGALPLSSFRVVRVRGADAGAWLQDLLTADVAGLEPGRAARSLLLGPTGRIRADLHVWRVPDGFVLVQPSDQPTPVTDLLAPYVLSSDVELDEGPVPAIVALPAVAGWRFVDPAERDVVIVTEAAFETWRIRLGIPRFPADLDEDSLPAEGGLDDGLTIDRGKGCYLGQESVARVRNLGHPTRVVLAVRAGGTVARGDPVLADGAEVGAVTSVAEPGPDGVRALVRVRWDARRAELSTSAGVALHRV